MVRPTFEKNDARLNYNVVYQKDSILSGFWAFNGSNGPTLLVHMKTARNIRLSAATFEPKVNANTNYEFTVIVDGKVLTPTLSNWSSIDVWGKQVLISLASWPPSSTGLYVSGTYQIF